MPLLLDLLAAIGLATGVARSAAVYALISAGHVLGIALLIGPVLLADLRLLGWLRGIDASALLVLRRTARLGAGLALATGLLLLSARPHEYAGNAIVWLKLMVVAAALANAALFEWRAARLDGTPPGGCAAALSIALWLAALMLGRWIAFS